MNEYVPTNIEGYVQARVCIHIHELHVCLRTHPHKFVMTEVNSRGRNHVILNISENEPLPSRCKAYSKMACLDS